MRQFILLTSLLFIAIVSVAQNDISPENEALVPTKTKVSKVNYGGISGGMMLHAGYQFGQGNGFIDENKDPAMLRSITYGIGGAIRVSLLGHMHIGGEGYVSTMPLKSQGDGSNIRSGWGGLLADYYIPLGRTQLLMGATIGGGAQKSIHVISDQKSPILGEDFKDTWENIKQWQKMEGSAPAAYTRVNFFAFDPFIALEYALTDRIHLIWKVDWLVAAHAGKYLTPSGPRIYMGMLFGH